MFELPMFEIPAKNIDVDLFNPIPNCLKQYVCVSVPDDLPLKNHITLIEEAYKTGYVSAWQQAYASLVSRMKHRGIYGEVYRNLMLLPDDSKKLFHMCAYKCPKLQKLFDKIQNKSIKKPKYMESFREPYLTDFVRNYVMKYHTALPDEVGTIVINNLEDPGMFQKLVDKLMFDANIAKEKLLSFYQEFYYLRNGIIETLLVLREHQKNRWSSAFEDPNDNFITHVMYNNTKQSPQNVLESYENMVKQRDLPVDKLPPKKTLSDVQCSNSYITKAIKEAMPKLEGLGVCFTTRFSVDNGFVVQLDPMNVFFNIKSVSWWCINRWIANNVANKELVAYSKELCENMGVFKDSLNQPLPEYNHTYTVFDEKHPVHV